MKELWQFWEGVVIQEDIDNIFAMAENEEWQETGLGFDGSTRNDEYRSGRIKWLRPRFYPGAKDLVWHFATTANKNSFGFDIDKVDDIQFSEYSGSINAKYDWHHDTFWANPTMYDRKISVVIQLTDPSEYEGGDFLIDNQYPQPDPERIKKKGSVIVFPSFIPHCVTPVTKGTRHSLVSWIEGPKFR